MADIRYNPSVSLLCKQVQAGSDAAFNQLWAQFSKFAVSVANRIAVQHTADRRDLVLQACRLGIWQAAMRYDPDKGAFTTYAAFWIRNAVHDAIGELMQSHGMSDIDLYAEDLPAGDADSDATRSVISALRRLVDTPTSPKGDRALLSPVERSVLSLILRDMNQVEIAKELCVSKQRVNQICKQLSAKLQQLL